MWDLKKKIKPYKGQDFAPSNIAIMTKSLI